MSRYTVPALLVFLACAFAAASGQEKKKTISEKQFRRMSVLLLEDPLGEDAKDIAKGLVIFAMETPDAAVFLGKDELKWMGDDKERGLLLMAAYLAGNTQSQLFSGVKRNDRYSGLLHLFQVYRVCKDKDKKFKLPEVESLLKMHREDKLIPYLQVLEQKSPTKLPKDDEEFKNLKSK